MSIKAYHFVISNGLLICLDRCSCENPNKGWCPLVRLEGPKGFSFLLSQVITKGVFVIVSNGL